MTAKEERTAARDFCMARLAAARAHLRGAEDALDEILQLMIEPADDKRGKKRADLLEGVDAAVAETATAVQMAQEAWSDCDPEEGEPEPDDDDDDEEDEEDDEDDEDGDE